MKFEKRINKIKISKNFYLCEFESPDTHEVKIDPELLEKLQKLRDMIKKPIIITSGYRTKKHNRKIGGAPRSYHLQGKAADIIVKGIPKQTVVLYAHLCNFQGIITYRNKPHIHLDTRQEPYHRIVPL